VTGPHDGDPAEEPIEGKDEGLPADDLQVRESGLVAGGSAQLAGYNVAGRDLTISVTGYNAAGRDLTIHHHFTSDSDTEAFIDEQLPALPPPVREPIRRLRVRHRAQAAQLAGVLADLQVSPGQIVQDLTGTPAPSWLADLDAPVDAWIAVAEFASAHGSYRAAAATFAKVASLGAPGRAMWLAHAALTMIQTGDEQAALGYLNDAEGLAGDGVPFVAAVRAALSSDGGRVLAAAGSSDIHTLEPVEFAMLCANAYAAQGDRDTAIAAFEALADRHPELGGFALRAAQLRLERVVDSTSPGHASDVRQARRLALRARDARRRWRGDSAEAVVVACHAAMIAVDFDRVLTYGLAAPAGAATPAEATAPAVLECAATAAIALDQRDLAVRLINQLPDSAAQATCSASLRSETPLPSSRPVPPTIAPSAWPPTTANA
jgi:tetratricopeptide (TPR) repeat protein